MTPQPNTPFTPRRRQNFSAHAQATPRRRWRWIVLAVVAVVCVAGAAWQTAHRDEEPTSKKTSPVVSVRSGFPVIAVDGLSDSQKKVLMIAQQEYQKNPTKHDATVMKYTEGFHESWCADFISWVFYRAGVAYVHPDTKYWRIPGVQTLQTYYDELGAYHAVGDGYVPKLGDVAFYFGETPDGGSSEHVAMVLDVRGDTIVTIGGNESDKRILQVRSNKMEANVKGLTGFGASGLGR